MSGSFSCFHVDVIAASPTFFRDQFSRWLNEWFCKLNWKNTKQNNTSTEEKKFRSSVAGSPSSRQVFWVPQKDRNLSE